MSLYKLQIVGPDGKVITSWEPGRQAETDLLKDISDRAVAKGVGFFTSEAVVKSRLEEAIQESVRALKRQALPIVSTR